MLLGSMLGFIGSIGVEGGQGNADCIFTTCDDHDRKDITIFPSTLFAFVVGPRRERIVLCLLGARSWSSWFGCDSVCLGGFLFVNRTFACFDEFTFSCCPVSVVAPVFWPSWIFCMSKSHVSELEKPRDPLFNFAEWGIYGYGDYGPGNGETIGDLWVSTFNGIVACWVCEAWRCCHEAIAGFHEVSVSHAIFPLGTLKGWRKLKLCRLSVICGPGYHNFTISFVWVWEGGVRETFETGRQNFGCGYRLRQESLSAHGRGRRISISKVDAIGDLEVSACGVVR